jgi:hypothetical protein
MLLVISFPISLFPLSCKSVVFGHESGPAERWRQACSAGGCANLIAQHIVPAQVEKMLPVVFFCHSEENAYFRAVQKKRALSTGINLEKCRST